MKSFIQDLNLVSGKQVVHVGLSFGASKLACFHIPHVSEKCMSSFVLSRGPGVTRTLLSSG